MKNFGKLLTMFMLIFSVSSCSNYIWGMRHNPPIPTKDYYEVKFKLYIYNWEDFQEVIKFYFGKPQPGTVGLTIREPNGEKIVILPRRKDGTIKLEDLGDGSFYTIDADAFGHEIHYHIMENDPHFLFLE